MSVAPSAIRCPRCGGTPEPAGGPARLARCASCGALGRIEDRAGGQQRVAVAPAVDGAFARAAVCDALARRTGRPATEVRVIGEELLHAPFWRVQSVVVGRVRGRQVERERTLEKVVLDNGQTFWSWRDREPLEHAVDRDVEKIHVAVVTACPLAELGLPSLGRHRQTGLEIPLAGPLAALGQIEVFEPSLRETSRVLDPLVGRPAAEREAEELLDAYRSGLGAGLLADARLETAVVDRWVLLVFHPLRVVRYALAEGRGTGVVDAARGRVVALRPPSGLRSPEITSAPLVPLGLAFAGAAAARLAASGALAAIGLGGALSGSGTVALGAAGSAAMLALLARDRGRPGAAS